MQIFLKYLKAKKAPYVLGGKPVQSDYMLFWVTENNGRVVSQVLFSKIKLLISSGIFQLFVNWHSLEHSPEWSENGLFQLLKSEGVEQFQVYPLSLHTNILLVFYIYIPSCLLSTLVLLLEISYFKL